MKGKNKKKQIAKISIFITSIFVILFSVTYAFITQVISGTKQVVVTAGVLDLVLEEENEIAISDALPMYDEVGMIQEPFTFRLVNNGSAPVNYNLKLVDITPQTVERKCSELGEITLDSPTGCRETLYPEELRQEALMLCQDWYPDVTTEEECIEANEYDGFYYDSFEEFIDEGIMYNEFEDTRTLVDTYPDNVVKVSVWELEDWSIRYGLTKNGENTIGSIEDMEYTWKIDDPELRARALEVCKNWYSEVTDEASCLETVNDDWGTNYKTFDDFVGEEFWPNGGRRFTLDIGKIGANETINYDLRLWISEYVEDIEYIEDRTFSFKIDVEVSQEIVRSPSSVDIKLFASDNLGENCKTYDDGVDTFLVGQCSNNYVWYSGKLWRVVLKNNETGAVKMVTDNAITVIPYNVIDNAAFENSYMDQWLTQEFLPTLHDYENYLVTDSIWDATEYSSTPEDRPSYTTTVTRTVGLLSSYEYFTTIIRSDNPVSHSTEYLNNGVVWLLMTPYNLSSVRFVNNGALNFNSPTVGCGARPSVNLKSTIQISGGSGIESDPYILEGDMQEPVNGTTLLNTRYSGEYITFNNELYRIVNVENGLTKITAVDIPNILSSNKFNSTTGTGTSNFANASIKTDLENYYQGLKTTNETAYDMIEPSTTWYLGTVGSGVNYKASICANINANTSMNDCEEKATSTTASIGLPRVGELFTSQITRGTKVSYWTLTPYLTYSVRFVHYSGSLHDASSASGSGNGARPSMYLKQNVVIASNNTGNGTYEHPYSIELGQ